MTDWQLIDTAPEEGRFLVFGGTWIGEVSGEHPSPRAVMVDRRYGPEFSVADAEYYGAEIKSPTHWMPLPKDPTP